MPLSDFRDTYSWQEAIALGPHLVQLAEDLPAGEQMGLAMQLRQEMVRLPAAIALDLLEKDSFARRKRALRLVAMIDLIDKIYPALDTAQIRSALEKLTDRLSSDEFGERTQGAKPVQLPGAMSAADANDRLAAERAEVEKPAIASAPRPAPISVPVLGDEPAPHPEAEASQAAPEPAPETAPADPSDHQQEK